MFTVHEFSKLYEDSQVLIANVDLLSVNAGTAIKVRPDGRKLVSFSFKVVPGTVIEDVNLTELKSEIQKVNLRGLRVSDVEKVFFFIDCSLEFRIQVCYLM